METGTCPKCGESMEPGYMVCWKCGTHADGAPPGEDFVPDNWAAVPTKAKDRGLSCLRCGTPMTTVSRMRFHEGTRAWPFLFGELGELFVNRQVFDTYACKDCGKVEFFVTD